MISQMEIGCAMIRILPWLGLKSASIRSFLWSGWMAGVCFQSRAHSSLQVLPHRPAISRELAPLLKSSWWFFTCNCWLRLDCGAVPSNGNACVSEINSQRWFYVCNFIHRCCVLTCWAIQVLGKAYLKDACKGHMSVMDMCSFCSTQKSLSLLDVLWHRSLAWAAWGRSQEGGTFNLEARWKALLHRADQPSLGPCFFCRYDDQASRQLLDKASLHQLVWSLAVLPVSLPTKYFGSGGIMCNAPWQRSRRCHWGALHTYPGFLASLLHLPCSSTNSFVFYRACWRSLPIRTMEIVLAPVSEQKRDCEKLWA